ncbi:MAG: nuclear transport factor 2 family protein [Nitrospirae bacterium]|nr:nuclear transport factor 2 family protein [Nitrospirota bacterium]
MFCRILLDVPVLFFRAATGTWPVTTVLSLMMLAGFGQDVLAKISPAESGSASGTVTIDGSKLRLKHAYGMAQPNTFDKQKTDIAVLITEQPLPEDALSELEDLMDATQKQHNWVFFKINAEGKPIYEVLDHPKLGNSHLMMSGFTHAAFTAKTLGKGRVEGTFETGKAVDFMGYQYEIKVVFQTPLVQAKLPEPLPDEKSGSSLPAGGGKPGKAYLAYVKAILTGDVKSIRRFLSPDKADLTDDELKEGLELLRQMTPEDLKIIKGFTAGDRAVLYVAGTVEKEKEYGTIEMKKTGGEWQIVRESWSNTLPRP